MEDRCPWVECRRCEFYQPSKYSNNRQPGIRLGSWLGDYHLAIPAETAGIVLGRPVPVWRPMSVYPAHLTNGPHVSVRQNAAFEIGVYLVLDTERQSVFGRSGLALPPHIHNRPFVSGG